MASNEDFENTLKLTKTALVLSGVNLFENNRNHILESYIRRYLFHINFVTLYAVIFGEIYWVIDGIQTDKTFVELSLTSPCITISILGTIKSASLYCNRDILVNVVDELKRLHPDINEEDIGIKNAELEDRNVIVNESMKFLKLVMFLLASISVVVIIMFCFSPILAMGCEYYLVGVTTVKYPYSVKYFFDAYSTSWWVLIYFLQVWATTIVCLNIFGSDTLFYALCSYTGMHFRLLGVQFENVVALSLDETKYRIYRAVKRHQELINLVDRTEILYSKSLLFNIVTSSLLICLSAFNITVTEDFRTMFAFITFLTMSLSQISLLCLFGDKLMAASIEVCKSIYKCRWYDVDNGSKKTILIALMRAQKACRLTAARFADLNLAAFTTILSRAWSYFALLKTIFN